MPGGGGEGTSRVVLRASCEVAPGLRPARHRGQLEMRTTDMPPGTRHDRESPLGSLSRSDGHHCRPAAAGMRDLDGRLADPLDLQFLRLEARDEIGDLVRIM